MTYIKLAGFAVALMAAAGASWYVKDNIDGNAYKALELKQSHQETANVAASLTQLQGFIGKMDAAGVDYTNSIASIDTRFAQLQKDFDHARAPLPLNCRPPTDRVQQLHRAVDATRQSPAATQ